MFCVIYTLTSLLVWERYLDSMTIDVCIWKYVICAHEIGLTGTLYLPFEIWTWLRRLNHGQLSSKLDALVEGIVCIDQVIAMVHFSNPCENFSKISARFWPPRFSSRRDLGRDLGEISPVISPLMARSRRDKNLGGQKRAEISGEISARWKSWRPKTRRDYWRDLGEMKISAAKNAPRLVARSRWDENLGGQKHGEISGEISARWESQRS